MLHIVPQKRPTAAQILRHSWLWQPPQHHHQHPQPQSQHHLQDNRHANVNLHTMPVDVQYPKNNHHLQHQPVSGAGGHHDQTAALRGAVNATFRAIASPQAANVGPVGMSELARRRAKDKVTHTHL